MKNNKKQIALVVALVVFGVVAMVSKQLSWSSEKEKNPEKEQEVEQSEAVPFSAINFIMDTFIESKLYGNNAEEATAEIARQLTNYENKMSMHKAGTEISKINAAAGKEFVKVSDETFELLKKAKDYCKSSNGVFDITIAPLTTLWGITSDSPKVPTQEEIDKLLPLIDYNDIILNEDNKSVMLKYEGQSIDLGGVAKGASADIVTQVARDKEITSGYVSLGGNMVVIGDKPDGQPYRFGIRDPRGGASEYICAVNLKDNTMATTGGYERFFEENGKTYIHVLDPKTGYPVETDLISVSIISSNGALADYLSTSIFMQGKQAVLDNLDNDEFSIVAVDKENNVFISKGLEDKIVPHETKTQYKYMFYNDVVEREN